MREPPGVLGLVALLALGLCSPARLMILSLSGEALVLQAFPAAALPRHAAAQADLDEDERIETVSLDGGRAFIRCGRTVLWVSDPDWAVVQAEVTDLDQDGKPEVALLLWREFSPWPIDAYLPYPGRIASFHDSSGRACHLILIGWRRGAFREVWAGSALADPLLSFAAADLDGDERQELIALEARYDAAPARALTVWEWNGFGFSLQAHSPEGRFVAFTPLRSPGTSGLLLVQAALEEAKP